MVRELTSRDYVVYGFDIAARRGGLGDVNGLFSNDIGWAAYADHCYDLVVHCAYHVGGRSAIDGTNMNFAKNVRLDAGLFEWAQRTEQKRVLYFSSSAVYPVGYQTESFRDLRDDYDVDLLQEDVVDISLRSVGAYMWDNFVPMQPDANYGLAKLVGERMAEDSRRNGLDVTVVRPFSGYGEDQSLDYPFPSIIQRAREGDLSVWGPPGQCRDWIHVDDVVRGALAVADSGTVDPVNLCTGVATEMGKLAQGIYEQTLLGPRGMVVAPPYDDPFWKGFPKPHYLEDKPTGVYYRVGDPVRMLQYYTPQVSLDEGIRRALAA